MYISRNGCRFSMIRIWIILLMVSLPSVIAKESSSHSLDKTSSKTRLTSKKSTTLGRHQPSNIHVNAVEKNTTNNKTTNKTTTSTKREVLPTISLNRDNASFYYANVTIGTPGKEELLEVDIVEPYAWIFRNFSEANMRSSSRRTHSSTTSRQLYGSRIFHLDFIISEDINATAVTDRFAFSGLPLFNRSFPAINSSRSSYHRRPWVFYDSHELEFENVSFFETNGSASSKGVLGLGGRITDPGNDIDSSKFDSTFFFLENLRNNGIINSSSYSLWLGGDTRPYNEVGRDIPDELDCGKIILGGVDPEYYNGPLKKFNKLVLVDPKTENKPSRGYPALPMGTIYVVSNSNDPHHNSINVTNEDFQAPVLLDSRSLYSHLPAEAIVQIAVQVRATEKSDRFLVPCSIADYHPKIRFEFGDLSIDVPFEDFLIPSWNSTSNSTSDEQCIMTMMSTKDTGFNILGTSFLKNTYLVVDHDDESIAIAQARKKTNTASNSGNGNNLTDYLSPVLSSTQGVQLITSGCIPYAVSSNETTSMTLSLPGTPLNASRISDQLSATFPNPFMPDRSFYNTDRPSSSSSSTSTSSTSTKKNNAIHNFKPPEIADVHWRSYTFSLLAIFILVAIW